MKVFFTPEAERQAGEMDAWWREHRPQARDLFSRELAEVRELISGSPNIGSKYATRSGKPARRVFMPKTRNHVYFQVDEAKYLIVILAVWGAPRGRGPNTAHPGQHRGRAVAVAQRSFAI